MIDINELNFTFFSNYSKVIEELENEEDKKDFIYAIYSYIYKNEIPMFEGIKKIAWLGIVNSLETSKNRASSKKIKKKSNSNQNQIKKKSKQNQTPSISTSISISYFKDNKDIDNIFKEYLKLRIDNKYTMTETVIKRLINFLNKCGNTDEEKKEIILKAITGKWKDFYPLTEIDKQILKKKEKIYL